MSASISKPKYTKEHITQCSKVKEHNIVNLFPSVSGIEMNTMFRYIYVSNVFIRTVLSTFLSQLKLRYQLVNTDMSRMNVFSQGIYFYSTPVYINPLFSSLDIHTYMYDTLISLLWATREQ